MARHLQREIENLKKHILTLGAIVENSVRQATMAIQDGDANAGADVINKDIEIDHLEVTVEEECLKILALHQPVATDLRFIIAILKINNDLERIGDLAVNIAERAIFLADNPAPDISVDLMEMARKAQRMLKQSLDALVNLSDALANEVLLADDEVDALNRQMYIEVQEAIREHPDKMESLLHLLSASRHLERIADHATNIAEDVIYMIRADIVRHKTELYTAHLPQMNDE
ncbi:MAG: phosphate signaling complex protein PhoU [Sedimentisphaerales bacterium]|nr:phosphate signaling complex protein PhoU [Sedimentisphaerales bacterium]